MTKNRLFLCYLVQLRGRIGKYLVMFTSIRGCFENTSFGCPDVLYGLTTSQIVSLV